VQGNGSPEVTRTSGAKHRLSSWCPQPADHCSAPCPVCTVTSLSFTAAPPLLTPFAGSPAHWSVSGWVPQAGGTLNHIEPHAEPVPGSGQSGQAAQLRSPGWTHSPAGLGLSLSSTRLWGWFSVAVSLRSSAGVVWSGLCLLYSGLFISLNFNDLTPVWRLLLPVLSLCSGTCFSPGQLPFSCWRRVPEWQKECDSYWRIQEGKSAATNERVQHGNVP